MTKKPSSNAELIVALSEEREILALQRDILMLENEIKYLQGQEDASISIENQDAE